MVVNYLLLSELRTLFQGKLISPHATALKSFRMTASLARNVGNDINLHIIRNLDFCSLIYDRREENKRLLFGGERPAPDNGNVVEAGRRYEDEKV